MVRRKILIIATLLHSIVITKAFAQEKSCHSLFEVTRPSAEEIEKVFTELKTLAAQRYSKDSVESYMAKSLFDERMRQINPFFTPQEIKERMHKTELIPIIEVAISRRTGDKIMRDMKKIEDQEKAKLEAQNIIDTSRVYRGINHGRLGRTPLTDAIEDTPRLVQAFIAIGADVNIPSGQAARTPLMVAASKGKINTLKVLLKNNADVSLTDRNQNTALHYAVKGKNHKVVNVLLQTNIDINARNNENKSALDLAKELQLPSIEQLLIEKGAK